MISKWKRPYASGRGPERGLDSRMVELNELAQAVRYRGARALVAPASKGGRIERIERRRRQKLRQGEERGLEGGDVERNKGRWNGGVGEAAKAMRRSIGRIGGSLVALEVAQWRASHGCAREMSG